MILLGRIQILDQEIWILYNTEDDNCNHLSKKRKVFRQPRIPSPPRSFVITPHSPQLKVF